MLDRGLGPPGQRQEATRRLGHPLRGRTVMLTVVPGIVLFDRKYACLGFRQAIPSEKRVRLTSAKRHVQKDVRCRHNLIPYPPLYQSCDLQCNRRWLTNRPNADWSDSRNIATQHLGEVHCRPQEKSGGPHRLAS